MCRPSAHLKVMDLAVLEDECMCDSGYGVCEYHYSSDLLWQYDLYICNASYYITLCWNIFVKIKAVQSPFYGHYAGQPALAGTSS